MVPIKYRVVGEEDYAFDVEIGETGEYRVSGGTYTSQPPHTGRLSGEQEAELLAAVGALGAPGAHPMPREAAAFEAHLAIYPPGTYYHRHIDQFIGIGTRRVTCTLYLNEDWQAADGGQLRIYTDPDDPQYGEDILPLGGTLVTFLSARFLHEVLPARRSRMSITGWFRTREI